MSTSPTVRRAARYMRMSTDQQVYSLRHQAAALDAYATRAGLEIVRTYVDEGRSGLEIRNRPGLQALLGDVVSGAADFEVILTYDVSRWGRFQDPDQAAHYEFLCREAGVGIEYCAEPFHNDGAVTSAIVKQIKRLMAAEYSRDLSAKVAFAQQNLVRLGFWVGGPPGYGLRRRIVRADGSPGRVLEAGDQKAGRQERVVLVPGPDAELEVVRRIFRLFVVGGMTRRTIAATLNAEGEPAAEGAPWSPFRVHAVLRNEKYAGVLTLGRRGGRLSPARDRDAWVRGPLAFAPIVSRARFDDAQRAIARRMRLQTRDEMLDGLRRLLAETGRLNRTRINEDERIPCAQTYQARFGSLLAAYREVGFTPDARAAAASERYGVRYRSRRSTGTPTDRKTLLAGARALLAKEGYLSMRLIDAAPDLPSAQAYAGVFGSMGRLYALLGYEPTRRQALAMARMTGRERWCDPSVAPRRRRPVPGLGGLGVLPQPRGEPGV